MSLYVIENADATLPHLYVLWRLGSSDGVQGSLQFFAFGFSRNLSPVHFPRTNLNTVWVALISAGVLRLLKVQSSELVNQEVWFTSRLGQSRVWFTSRFGEPRVCLSTALVNQGLGPLCQSGRSEAVPMSILACVLQ